MVQKSKRHRRGYSGCSEQSPNPIPIHPVALPQTTIFSRNVYYR